ncbi:hypothetical protein TNCV_2683481 [Trichonephila clavipes]|nr:hypothetical protein TNCV_2683481 [Trichonephila clavipes]
MTAKVATGNKSAERRLWKVKVHKEGEKDYNDDHRDEITDFSQSTPRFQECHEDTKTWIVIDAEDSVFGYPNNRVFELCSVPLIRINDDIL